MLGQTSQLIGRLSWVGEPPVVSVTRDGQTIRIDAELAPGDAQWRQLAQLAAVAMVLSHARPLWLWTVRDGGSLLYRKLKMPNLVAWRGIYGEHPTPTPAWSPDQVRKDRALDEKVRYLLSQVIESEMRALHIRFPDPINNIPKPARLMLFDYLPAEGWKQAGVAARALALIGRSMFQLDGRRSRDGLWHVTLRVEVFNPNEVPLAGAQVQVRMRDEAGGLLGVFEASSPDIPPGGVRLITSSGEVVLGALQVSTIDIGCEALLSRSVDFQATIREV
jgi:hypothetical protein